MVILSELTAYLDDFLNFSAFAKDHSNNGLQVEASREIRKIATGVDACIQFYELAANWGADLAITHHGISWGGEPRRFTGIPGKHLKYLFTNRLSLYAAHLPLDAHPMVGNNAVLADLIKLENKQMFCEYDGSDIGVKGILSLPRTAEDLAETYNFVLNCQAKIYCDTGKPLTRIGCISGGAGRHGLEHAISSGLDALVIGEMEHQMYHLAKEAGIVILALGHYCSEKTGVTALGVMLAEKFGLEVEFIDIPTTL